MVFCVDGYQQFRVSKDKALAEKAADRVVSGFEMIFNLRLRRGEFLRHRCQGWW